MGRAAEPAEDRAVVVQRRKKQRLQVRWAGVSVAGEQLQFLTCGSCCCILSQARTALRQPGGTISSSHGPPVPLQELGLLPPDDSPFTGGRVAPNPNLLQVGGHKDWCALLLAQLYPVHWLLHAGCLEAGARYRN